MSEAREYVLVYDKDKTRAKEIVKETAEKLQNRQATLLEIVESLGEYINDEDEKIRARAVSFLSDIIGELPPNHLSRQQIQVLCNFLCDRIEDGGAIEGLSTLQSSERFTNDMAQTVVRALFEHFMDIHTRVASVRFHIYQFLNEIMNRHRKAVRNMGDESLIGITDFVAGEKDPRNLMIVFSILRVLLLEWDISHHIGTMFDSVYAYFPITFRPHPNDPYGITAQELKDRLRECLCCSSLLAQYLMPGLLEKLDSTSTMTKKDVMQTMTSCAHNYEPSVMAQYSIPLWDALKYEVLSAQEPELADEALVVLRSIATCLSSANAADVSSESSPLLLYLKPIVKECLEHFHEPAQRQAKASGEILQAVSSANSITFDYITKNVVSPLLVIYQSVDGILQQRAVLEIINLLFASAITIFGSWNSQGLNNTSREGNSLIEFKDQFLTIYGQALMGTVKEEVSFRLTAAKGLLLLSSLHSFLQEDEIGLVVQYYNDIVLNEESYGRDELKTTAMAGLVDVSSFKSRLISDITFPAFMARLPDTENHARGTSYLATLEGLADISVQKDLLEIFVRRLLNKLDILFRLTDDGPFPYTCAILSTIYKAFKKSCDESSQSALVLEPYFERLVVGIGRLLGNVNTSKMGGPLTNETVLELLGRVENIVIRHSSRSRLPNVADNVYRLFSERSPDNGEDVLPSNLSSQTPVITSTWILAALPRELQAPLFQVDKMTSVIQELMLLTRSCPNYSVRIASLRQIALYTNKHFQTADTIRIHQILSELFAALISNARNPLEVLDWDIRLTFTFAKALVLRLVPKTRDLLSEIAMLLEISKFGPITSRLAASAFSSILAADDVLSKENYAQIRLLSHQRVFQLLTPLIASKFRTSSSSEEKQNYLTALSGVVGTVPPDIVMPELPTLLPLLLQSLDISDQTVKTATLETIATIILNNPSALEESGHIPALVKRLLASAAPPKLHSKVNLIQSLPKTRRLATRCLALLPVQISGNTSGANPLLALKREVLQGLMAVLDDPRRDVRKEAVDARSAWFRNVDDPQEDEEDD